MSKKISPFLAMVCEELGLDEPDVIDAWTEVCEHVSSSRNLSLEDMGSEDYEEAVRLLKTRFMSDAERDALDLEGFIKSELDAKRYLETIFVQSSPEGQEVYDDEGETKLLTKPAAGFKAAGLMAPNGSVGESVDEDDSDELIESISSSVDEILKKGTANV